MAGLATWLSQRAQAKAQWQSQNQLRRQDTYRVFIEQASKLYVEALQNDHANVSGLMGLYAQVSRMRVLYLEPNKTFPELQKMAAAADRSAAGIQ
jgi:hypothetical protein